MLPQLVSWHHVSFFGSLADRIRTSGRQCRVLFDEAAIRYQTSDYRAAVETYTEAYRLSFEIKDAEVRQFRSLTASMCLAQTLVISYAYRFGLDKPAEE